MVNRQKPIHYLLILFIIYSTDTMIVATNTNPIFKNLSHMTIILLMFFLIFYHIKQPYAIDKQILTLILTCIFLYASMLFTRDFTGGYILKMILFITGYFFIKKRDLISFSTLYIKCMYIISIFSILGVIISIIMPTMEWLPTITNIAGNKYAFTIFNNLLLNNFSLRNYGPFWEPGVYQAYLNLAVTFYLFVTPYFKRKVLYVLILAILTTCSTTGYVVLFLVLSAYFFKEKRVRLTYEKLALIMLLISSITILLLSPLQEILFRKFSPNSYEFNSFFSRFGSIYTNSILTIKYPIFGVGPNNVERLSQELFENLKWAAQFTDRSQTNAILLNFSMFGIFIGFYYLTNLWGFVASIARSRLSFLILLLSFCLILFTEPLTYSLLFHILIFYRQKRIVHN